MNPTRRQLLGAFAALASVSAIGRAASPAAKPAIEVWKSPSCGCCGLWVEHLQKAGYEVKVNAVDDPGAQRARLGMPDKYGSCHTGIVQGYVIEGHVPASEINRLLAEKPKALGLAVPAMPAGSPGMEVERQGKPYRQAYDVLLITRDGSSTVYKAYPGGAS